MQLRYPKDLPVIYFGLQGPFHAFVVIYLLPTLSRPLNLFRGRFICIAGLKNLNGALEFFDTETLEVLGRVLAVQNAGQRHLFFTRHYRACHGH